MHKKASNILCHEPILLSPAVFVVGKDDTGLTLNAISLQIDGFTCSDPEKKWGLILLKHTRCLELSDGTPFCCGGDLAPQDNRVRHYYIHQFSSGNWLRKSNVLTTNSFDGWLTHLHDDTLWYTGMECVFVFNLKMSVLV